MYAVGAQSNAFRQGFAEWGKKTDGNGSGALPYSTTKTKTPQHKLGCQVPHIQAQSLRSLVFMQLLFNRVDMSVTDVTPLDHINHLLTDVTRMVTHPL